MMTRLSKWLLYIASYKWVYILQIASVIISGASKIDTNATLWDKLLSIVLLRKFVLLALYLLFIIAVLIQKSLKKIKNNTRIKYSVEDDAIFEFAFSSVAYIATILTISLNTYGMLLTLAIFIALGWIVDLTDRVYILPIFYLKQYHVYKAGEAKVITKMSREQYRLRMDDSEDGIEARELVINTYIVLDDPHIRV